MSEDMGFRKSFFMKLCATPVEGKFEGEKCFAQLHAEKMNPILAETEVAVFGVSADCPALVSIMMNAIILLRLTTFPGLV